MKKQIWTATIPTAFIRVMVEAVSEQEALELVSEEVWNKPDSKKVYHVDEDDSYLYGDESQILLEQGYDGGLGSHSDAYFRANGLKLGDTTLGDLLVQAPSEDDE